MVSGGLDWRQRDTGYDMRLRGPFNITVMRLFTDSGDVVLERLQHPTQRGVSAEQLSTNIWGTSLPFSSFPHWLKGVPVPTDTELHAVRSEGRLLRWQQSGWDIEIQEYRGRTGLLLPSRMTISRGPHVMHLHIKRWRALPVR